MFDLKRLESEVDSQLEEFETLRWISLRAEESPESRELAGKLCNTPRLNALYSRTDLKKMVEEYAEKLAEIKTVFFSDGLSERDNIAQTLEYIRFMAAYDNVTKIGDRRLGSSLSQSAISLVILGKGVCGAQGKFFAHLLDAEAHCINVTIRNETGVHGHGVVITQLSDEKIICVDPTNYNGTTQSANAERENIDSLSTNDRNHFGKTVTSAEEFEPLNLTEEEIERARKSVSDKLIIELKINEISKQLITSEMTDIEKHFAIFNFVEKIINVEDFPVDFATAILNGTCFEAGKLIELFFIANNIDYRIVCKGDKQNTQYYIKLNDEEVWIFPKAMYSMTISPTTGTRLTGYFHIDNDTKHVYNRTPDTLKEAQDAFTLGRIKAEEINLNEIFRENEKKIVK